MRAFSSSGAIHLRGSDAATPAATMTKTNTAARVTMRPPRSGLGTGPRRRPGRSGARTGGRMRAAPRRRTRGSRARRGRTGGAAAFDLGRGDQHRRDGNVVVGAPARGLHRRDLVDHLHPLDHLAEDGVAGAANPEIQGGVVLEVDEELRRRAVGVVRAGHGHRSPAVADAVPGLVADGRIGRLLVHVRGHASALDHEGRYDAVEEGAVIVALAHVFEEVLGGDGRLVVVEADPDAAETGFEHHHGPAGGGPRGGDGGRRGGGLRQAQESSGRDHSVLLDPRILSGPKRLIRLRAARRIPFSPPSRMVLFNYSTKELTAKVVYYRPGLCGKTTNLQWIHEKTPIKNKGKMLSLATEADRTVFFAFLPIDLGTIRGMKTRIQLYTVPGQVFYNATRRMVLKGADCVVFVADSQEPVLDANLDALANLKENLEANEIDPGEIPTVLQYNKRDLPNALPLEILNEKLNPRR